MSAALHEFMWAHPDLFTVLLFMSATGISAGMIALCYWLHGNDDE
jgi:hypothetical protein